MVTNGDQKDLRPRISNKYGSVTALKQWPNQIIIYVLEGGASHQV
jgi:hypothetical protein